MDRPETRYARSGEISIAYQVVGGKPFDLIWVPGWISNVEESWEVPEYAHFLHRLASFSRLATIEEVARQPVEQRLARMERTADDFADAIQGLTEAGLSRRPDEKNWAAKEIVCHLRDIEELWTVRAQTVLLAEDQMFLRNYPDRWAQERQYLGNDAAQALAAFRIRRREALDLFGKLSPAELQRTCNHAVLGRITLDRIVGLLAWHDNNHLDQLKRALEGKA